RLNAVHSTLAGMSTSTVPATGSIAVDAASAAARVSWSDTASSVGAAVADERPSAMSDIGVPQAGHEEAREPEGCPREGRRAAAAHDPQRRSLARKIDETEPDDAGPHDRPVLAACMDPCEQRGRVPPGIEARVVGHLLDAEERVGGAVGALERQ